MVLQALYSGFAQHVAPSSGVSPHSRPLGTVSADRQGGLLHGLARPCAQDLRSRSRRRSMCCRATAGGTTLRGGSGGGARAADGVGAAGLVCLAHALNSPRMARWMMPNRYPAGLRMPCLPHRAAHSSSTACRRAASTCCNAILAPACCSAFSSAKRLGHCRSPSARACAVVRTSSIRLLRTVRSCFGFRRAPSGAGFGPASDSEDGRAPFRSRASWPSSDSWSAPSCG